jgi:hypothetical protein
MVTTETWSRRALFRNERWARLLIDTLYHYRGSAYLLHEFVIKGFSDHRIRDAGDYLRHVDYVRKNPVRKHLCERAEEYPYSSAAAGVELDPVPQGLKPVLLGGSNGAPEGAPFQSRNPEGALFQKMEPSGAPEAAPFQSKPVQTETSSVAPVRNRLGKIA